MSSPLVELISISQQTEILLETRFGAQGRGLREKMDSVADQIPENVRKKIRFIATTRNLATHGELENAQAKLRDARKAFDFVRATLNPAASRRRVRTSGSQLSFFFNLKKIFTRLFSFGGGRGASFVRLNAIAKETERLLTRYYRAEGRGLHDKLTSVAHKLPEKTQRKIRFIATIRNKAAHEDIGVADENIAKIEEAFAEILPTLDRGATLRKIAFWTVATLGAALAAFVAFRLFG